MLFREPTPYRLRRIDLHNFKSVVDQSVELGPLTVVVGANSSGKSTLLQAVLAVSQALQKGSPRAVYPLNGDLLDLGTYRETRNFRAPEQSEPMTIGIGLIDYNFAGMNVEPTEQLPHDDTASFDDPNLFDIPVDLSNRPITPSGVRIPVIPTDPDPGRYSCHAIELDWAVVLRESSRDGSAEIAEVNVSMSVYDDHRSDYPDYEAHDPDHEWEFTLRSGVLARPEESEVSAANRRHAPAHTPVELQAGQMGCATNSRLGGIEVKFDALSLSGGVPLGVFARRRYIDHYTRALWSYWNRRGRESESGTHPDGLEDASDLRRKVVERAARAVRAVHNRAVHHEALEQRRGPTSRSELRSALISLEETRDWIARGVVDLEEAEINEQLYAELSQEPWINDEVFVPCRNNWVGLTLDMAHFAARDVFGCEGCSEFRYLGPLRELPRGGYPRASASGTDLGDRGEFMAEVLYENADLVIDAPLPDGEARETTLSTALNAWLDWFGLADRVSVEDLGRQRLEFKVRPEGAAHEVDLTSVGVGVSQILPVILNCLLSKFEGLLVFEQPELHLHPALQQRLADFLLTFVRAGRQILVETHSEHLVNRLRTQVAADETNQTGDLIKLLFAEQTDGITTYRESEINEFGGVSEDWPEGFLDLSAKSAQDLVRQSLNKRLRHEASS
ncbi:MAG: AAA family ATPase [Acidimicrobiaceae bacterium]|nr:AAA family ATPase [Acidimicrobiaceae bacterium]